MSIDKFLQPGIKIVERAKGYRTLLPDEVIAEAKARVANGADPEEVAMELAHREVEFIFGGREEES